MAERRPLRIGRLGDTALLQVAAFDGTLEDLERVVGSALGVELPKRIDTPARSGAHRVFMVGPGRFWIAGPQGAWVASLRQAVPPEVGCLTALSHARVRLLLDGPCAREVLCQGISLDLHPEVFRCDAYALTGLRDTPVLLHRAGTDRYELYVLRTFAEWIWEWLTDAALPFGCEVIDDGLNPDGSTPLAVAIE
jgi:heterotetrameric sarcosine oxidase gamma subunit